MKGRGAQWAVCALTSLLGCLAACSPPSNDSSAYSLLPPQGWNFADSVPLRLRLADAPDSALVGGTLSVAVRYGDTGLHTYPYSNLVLEVTNHTAGAERTDTVTLAVADRFGRWLGKGFGSSRQMEYPLAGVTHLRDSSLVSVRHIMRADTLRGVEQVGVIFTPLQ